MEIETSNLVDRLTVANVAIAVAVAIDGKPSLKGAWLGHVNYLNFGGTAAGRVVTSIVSGAVNLGRRSV